MAFDKAQRIALLDKAFQHVIEKYGHQRYATWKDLIGNDPIILPHPDEHEVDIEISPQMGLLGRWPDPCSGPILHTTRFGVSIPTARFLIDSANNILLSLHQRPLNPCAHLS